VVINEWGLQVHAHRGFSLVSSKTLDGPVSNYLLHRTSGSAVHLLWECNFHASLTFPLPQLLGIWDTSKTFVSDDQIIVTGSLWAIFGQETNASKYAHIFHHVFLYSSHFKGENEVVPLCIHEDPTS